MEILYKSSTWRGRLIGLIMAILCFAVLPKAYGQNSPGELRIVVGATTQAGNTVVEQIRLRFPKSIVVSGTAPLPQKSNARYIAVGDVALKSLLAQGIEDPIFTLMVPSMIYQEIISRDRRTNVTAIYAEASPSAQLKLIGRIFKPETRVAVLVTPRTAHLQPALRQAAAQANLRIDFVSVEGEGLNRALNQISNAAVLLALPDSDIYNAQSIQTILLTTYQQGQAVLGFSTSLVRAGALGTTYSTVEDMATQLDDIVQEHSATGRLPSPQHPKYFSTFINDSVSRSLDIVVDQSARKFGKSRDGK